MPLRDHHDVAREDVAPLAPPVGCEVLPRERGRIGVGFHEDDSLDGAPVKERKRNSPHARTQIERDLCPTRTAREVSEEERVDVHPIPFTAGGLREGDPSFEERVVGRAYHFGGCYSGF